MRLIPTFLLALSIIPASARTLYLTGEPAEDKYKVIPAAEQRTDESGRPTAVVLVYSELPTLTFAGTGVQPGVIYEDGAYAVHLAPGTTQMTIGSASTPPLAVRLPDTGSKHVYTLTVVEGDDNDESMFRQESGNLHIVTDPMARVEIDGVMVLAQAAADNYLTLPAGEHTIRACKQLDTAETGSWGSNTNETYCSQTRTLNLRPGGFQEADIPITGGIRFYTHNKHGYSNIDVTLEADNKNRPADGMANVAVPKSKFKVDDKGSFFTGLRGNYKATYSAYGYKTKKSTYSIVPGQMVDAEIKLDPAHNPTFVEYEFSLRSVLGLSIGGCGKYFGWFGKFYLMGVKDPLFTADTDKYSDDNKGVSIGGQTGPMFRILRARTNMFLTIGAGYERMYYDNDQELARVLDLYDDHFVASVKLSWQFPKGFTIGLVWNQPFDSGYKYDKYSSLYNLSLTLGGSF